MTPDEPQAGDPVSAATMAWILRELKRLGSFSVTPPLEMSDTSSGIAFSLNSSRPLYIKITGSTQDGSNLRWKYAWSEVEKTTAGYGGWAILTGGRTGTSSTNTAYNSIENINSASGTFGNGVASSNLVGTITVKPVPNSVIVRAERVSVGSNVEYWFSYENGVDGACPS